MMAPMTRLILCAMIIVSSSLYGLVIAYDAAIAEAIALGYVALLLTVFFAVNVWKKP
jgi:hypothetical protein